ncbi:MAG: rRNA maturation RNase YbeY, partial [Defluviitaleaceae bacterium]|nr:rRNA maturation RNase YbeY [Defluviitaleaceae bacterium]
MLVFGLKLLNVPNMAELSVSFVTAQEIQRLNKKFRNLDKPTDVLSFPLSEPEEWQKT